jgi:two-component system, sensor histidine kinase
MDDSTEATILHVNDYEPSRYTTSKLLRQAGFAIVEAGSGAEALKSIESMPVDLVLLDVGLPDFDGFEVCRRIRELPQGETVPVLLTSAAYVERDDRVRGLEGGADAYLVEPVEAGELIATIRALLRMRAAEAGLRTATKQREGDTVTADAKGGGTSGSFHREAAHDGVQPRDRDHIVRPMPGTTRFLKEK